MFPGRLRFRYIGATVTRIEILISAIDRGGIRIGVIGLAVAAAQVKQTLDPSTKTLANAENGLLDKVDGIKWFDDERDGPGSADSAKDGLKRSLSLEDSGGSIAIKGYRGGRYIRKSYHRQDLDDGLERLAKRLLRWCWELSLAGEVGLRLRGWDVDESDAAVDVVTADGMTGGQEPAMRMRRGDDGAGWIAAGSWVGWTVKGRSAGKGRADEACKGSQGLAWLGWAGSWAGRAGGVGRGSQGLAWLCWAKSWAAGRAGQTG
ncbi:hypothetical protein BY996DRAFT_6613490 [Phakopsora pachyrhizi]|nr:hypothetical protein BY996DRAFT_6613490 [Phakopsora pachyrhizi]